MSNYKVRPRDLIDLVNQIKSGALILSPHFQRKLVWREVHKIDFIQTILLQYPFPEIFISRGQIDLETQKSVSCVVDGQQRMNTIKEFLADNIVVNGKKYSEFPEDTRTTFLKTEIAVIDLDLHETDEKIIEIAR